MKYVYVILVLFLSTGSLNAQVCTGSLGEPTVTVNFGQGTGIGPSLPSSNTTYTYSSADCPNDGFYVINNKTTNCFGSTWHTLTEDHTPNDTNGYMMVVNAANDPGIFYTFSVDNLCPNTTYSLSSFIVNIRKMGVCYDNSTVKYPQITFRVEEEDGTLIKTYTTEFIVDTNTPQWKEYGFFFKSPPNVSRVILKLVNNSGGGCGNDLALDDITFRPCGPTILASETSAGNINLTLCEGMSKSYTFNSNVSLGYTNPAFVWQEDKSDGNGYVDIPNSNNTNINVSIINADIKGYAYRMAAAEQENIQSNNCRVFSNAISINVNPALSISAGEDIYILENAQAKILASAPANLKYEWTPNTFLDDPASLQPTATPPITTTYTLTVTDLASGCTASDEVTVFVDLDIKIPDSFSPNGDGVNDVWEIKGLLGNADVDISIFNRNGQKVYQSKGYPKAFDGKLKNQTLPTGMYYYMIDTHSAKRPVYSGSLLIIY